MKRIVKTAAVIILALIALLNVCTMLFSSLNLRERLNWFPAALLEVSSGSMEPRLSVGDLLVVWETPYEELSEGDIITFHYGNELITHELRRWEGSRLVTKGIANMTEDVSIGPEEYCARMLFAIPKGAVILNILTSPIHLALSVVLLLFLFYGMPLLKKLLLRMENGEDEVKRPGSIRIAASITAVSMLAVTPFMTAAKYTAKMNEFTMAVAEAKYFSSNYISEEGTSYDIRGWNGENYLISLQIRNYANDLLFNALGHDLTYSIRLVKVEDSSYKTDYSLSLVPPDGILQTSGDEFSVSDEWPAGDTYGPYVLTGDNNGGKSSIFSIMIASDQIGDEYALKPGDKIRFQIYAGTESDKEYYQQMMGDFTLSVATANSFLGEQNGNTEVGTSLVTYSIKTNQVGGNSTRNIKISWDKNKLYVNEYEATIQNLKLSHPDYLVLDDGNGRGYAILPLQAYSSIGLQFFKYDANSEVHFDEYNDAGGIGHVADIYALEEGELEPVPPSNIDPTEDPEDDESE